MATILAFPVAAARKPGRMNNTTPARILFFTGVRYSRLETASAPAAGSSRDDGSSKPPVGRNKRANR